MNKRTREILKLLARQKETVSMEWLTEKFGVSERTIRNDVGELNKFLEENRFQGITIQKDGSFQAGNDLQKALDLNIEENSRFYHLSKEERMDIVMVLLINAKPSITINELCEQIQVSRATITHELNEVKEALTKWDLKVVTYSNKGLFVEGTEFRKRYALYNLIWKTADITQVDDIRFPHYPGIDLNQVISADERKAICRIINEQEHLQETFFTDRSFARLQCYMIVVMIRIKLGMLLEPQPMAEARYPLAKELMSYISQYCDFVMSEDEVRALSRFLEDLRYIKKKADPEIIRVQVVTRRFILAVSETLQVGLTTDLQFYEDLSVHLTAILKRSVVTEGNPVVSQIADDYPNIYRAVRLHQNILEEGCGCSLSKSELEYIVVHICTAVERITNNQRELSAVLVCGSGMVTSRLLYEKLSRHFHIIAMFSSHDITSIQNCVADLIISTVPLRDTAIETVQVSAMLTEEDSMRVFAKAAEIRKRWGQVLHPPAPVKDPRRLLRLIQAVIREETGEEDSALSRRVTEELRRYFDLSEEESTVLLQQLLTPEFIQVDVECRSWRQSVEASAHPLLEKDYINARYIDRVFDIIAENGQYMVVAKGLMLAHASFRDGVNRMGMNLIRLARPLDFGDADYQKDIRYVCCLSPVDQSSHLQALLNLTNLFGDEAYRKELDQAASREAIYDVICRYESDNASNPRVSGSHS